MESEKIRKVLNFSGKGGIINAVLDKVATMPTALEADQLKLKNERLVYYSGSTVHEVLTKEDFQIIDSGEF